MSMPSGQLAIITHNYYKSVWVQILCHTLGWSEDTAFEWIEEMRLRDSAIADWMFHDEPQACVMPFVYTTLCDVTYTGVGYERFMRSLGHHQDIPFHRIMLPHDYD